MATLGKLNGTLYKITIGGTAISNLTSNSMSVAVATRDVTTKDSSGNMEVLPTIFSATYSFEAIVALDATEGMEELYDVIAGKTESAVVFTTAVSGDVQFTQQGYITSWDISAPMEDNITITGSIQGTGAVTKADVA